MTPPGSLLHYIRAAAEYLGRRRVFRIIVRAEEAASVGLHAVQRGRRHAFSHQRAFHLERGVFRGGLHLYPRRLEGSEHGTEYSAIQQHACNPSRIIAISFVCGSIRITAESIIHTEVFDALVKRVIT